MELIRLTYKNTGKLHHAYCVETSGAHNDSNSNEFDQLCTFFEEDLSHPTKANPDFWVGQFETIGIDEGRLLKEMQLLRPSSHPRKVFVVQANSITREAQNSLLKIFEEPTPDTHFFLLLPSAAQLLPTLRSRLQIIEFARTAQSGNTQTAVMAAQFLKATKADRLIQLKDLIDEKDRAKVANFLHALEVLLRSELNPSKLDPAVIEKIESLLAVKKYVHDRSSSVKMILEHIALTI